MSTTLVDKIYTDLERKILDGRLRVNQKVPSILEIGRSHHASRGAVQYALKKLTRRGLLYSIHGKGTYVADHDGSSRRTPKLTDIAFMVTRSGNVLDERTQGILSGAEREAHAQGLRVVFSECQRDDFENLARRVDSLVHRPMLGIVWAGPFRQRTAEMLSRLRFPLVLTSDPVDPGGQLIRDIDIVTDNIFANTMTAVAQLAELGHKRIGFVSDVNEMAWGKLFREGFQAGLQSYHLAEDPALDVSLPPFQTPQLSYRAGWEVAKELAKRNGTAYFFPNTSMSAGVVDALIESGVKVPEDISIATYLIGSSKQMLFPMRTQHEISGMDILPQLIGHAAVTRLVKLRQPGNRSGRHTISGMWRDGTTTTSITNAVPK